MCVSFKAYRNSMGWCHGRELASPDRPVACWWRTHLVFFSCVLKLVSACLSPVAPGELGLYGYPLDILYLLCTELHQVPYSI